MVWRLGPLALLAVVPACATETVDEAESTADAAYTEEDARCYGEPLRAGESATDARARCLTSYATQLLDAQIARGEDARDRGLTAMRGKLRVLSETGCFTEDVSGSAIGAWQYDIDSKRDVGMIGVQLKASVEFLKYFYRDLDGYPNHLFDSMEICPNGQVKGDLALVGSRLRVGVRTGWFGRYGFHTSSVLGDKWRAGEQLDQNAALASLKGIRWAMLDPVGTPRTTLRRAVRRLVAKLAGDLEGLQGKPEGDVRAALGKMVRDETVAGATDDRSRNIRDRALAAIAAMSAAELDRLASAWKLELAKVDVTEGAEEGTVSMRDVMNHRDARVTVTQAGFVNVQNVHQFAVDTEAFLPRAANFTRYVEATRSTTTIEVHQFGFVNVQTNDLVDVRVQVLYGRTAQTASLDRVLPP